jgi:hypothetical protein
VLVQHVAPPHHVCHAAAPLPQICAMRDTKLWRECQRQAPAGAGREGQEGACALAHEPQRLFVAPPPVCEQAHTPPQAINWVPRRLSLSVTPCLQEKKEAEERRKQELNELFAMAIKQPKVPAGEQLYVQCRAEVGP